MDSPHTHISFCAIVLQLFSAKEGPGAIFWESEPRRDQSDKWFAAVSLPSAPISSRISQPPDPHPRPPTITVPPNACDCHVHLFGDPAKYPYLPDRRYTPSGGSPAEYRHMLRALGLTRAVVVQPAVYGDNRMTMDALAEASGEWRGIARIEPSITDAELTELHEAGFRGARFNFRTGAESMQAVEEIARRIAPFGWHIQIHAAGRYLAPLADSLSRLPTDVVIDHFGRIPLEQGVQGEAFMTLLDLLRGGRAWVKLSAPYAFADPALPYPSLVPYAQALVAAAPERLVWGSDWPHPSNHGTMPNAGALLDLLSLWAPDPNHQRLILVDNPARLYGFPS